MLAVSIPEPAGRSSPLPERFVVLDTHDLDESRELTTRLLGAHRSQPLRPRVPFRSRVYAAPLGRHAVTFVRSESWISVRSDAPDPMWSLWLPVSGETLHRVGRHVFQVSGQQGMAAPPGQGLSMVTTGPAETLILRLDPTAIARELGSWRPAADRGGSAISCFALREEWSLRLRNLVDRWCRGLGDEGQVGDAAGAHFDAALVSTLADALASSWGEGARSPDVGLQTVHRAEEMIWDRSEAPLSVGSLADAVGVSARSLLRTFQRVRGYGPMDAMRQARLLSVRAELVEGRPGTRVSEVAMRWGFLHLGRFAGAYARHFGELPSATLQRLGPLPPHEDDTGS